MAKRKTNIQPRNTQLSLHITKGLPPPFHEFGEYTFQELASDLMYYEPDIKDAVVFGKRGQSQYGIDVIATTQGNQKEVGQCKKYQKFTQKNIQKASQEFLDHWDTYWKDKKVTRFILLVSCQVQDTKCIEEIAVQETKFAQMGIFYELWDASKLERKLRPHKYIVEKFCYPTEHWVKAICGENDSYPSAPAVLQSQAGGVVQSLLVTQLTEVSSQLVEKHLQEIRTLWQEGKEEDSLTRLHELKRDSNLWTTISPELKARILCFHASVSLETGEELTHVEKLLNEAHTFADVGSEKRVRALLFMRQGQMPEALELLDGVEDVDTCNVRAALLLDARRNDEAQTLLSGLITQGKANAETYRLMALVTCIQRDLDQATSYIQQAKAREPKWIRVQLVEAIIMYYKSLSPAVVPSEIVSFPLPVDWILVHKDKAAQEHLHQAELIFSQLAVQQQRENVDQYFNVWRLACLLNDTQHQDDALELCKTILAKNPSYFPAIIWAVFRRLDINLEPSITALEEEIHREDVSLNSILALIALYEHTRRFADGLEVLDTTHRIFVTHQASEVWTIHYLRMLIEVGRQEEIEQFATTIPQDKKYTIAHSILASYRSEQSKNWDTYVANQLALFRETQSGEFLLDACMTLYRTQKWVEFTQYADELVSQIGTTEVYKYVVQATFNAGQYDKCLSTIEQWYKTFGKDSEQQEFLQVRVFCLHALGKYNEAVTEAKSLVEHSSSVTNILNLIQLLYELGEYDAVAVHAASIQDAKLHPETLLQLADLLKIHNQGLAQAFWRKAAQHDLPDEYTGTALSLAFGLGLDDEVGNLFPRLLSYDRKHEQRVEQFQTRAEITQKFESLHQRNADIRGMYRSGVIPLHFYAEMLNLSLSDLFHDDLKYKESSEEFLRTDPLYVRYGGRPLSEDFAEPHANFRVFLDITALLLAEHLGILSKVEAAFAPLYIPSETFPALSIMVSRTHHHQLSVIEANKEVLRLVHLKKLHIVSPINGLLGDQAEFESLEEEWQENYALAKHHNGYFLTFLPPTRLGEVKIAEPVMLSSDNLRYLTNCRTLVDTLQDRRELKRTEYKAALNSLGTLATKYVGLPYLQHGTFVICDDSIVDALARSGILEHACNVFNVNISQRKYETSRGVFSWSKDREDTRQWLESLQKRLRTGIQKRQYMTLPIREINENHEQVSISSNSLMSLIAQSDMFGEHDAVWIDDRFTNHFNRVGKGAAIGILEMLTLLVGKKVITEDDYYEYLVQLRAGNVRYIPLNPKELLYHLIPAVKKDDDGWKVDETRPLRVIRRYIAACVAHRQDLQIPPVPEQITHEQGEAEFILNLHRVVQQSLYEIWRSVSDEETRQVLAEWIITNISLDYPSLILRERDGRPKDQPDYYRVAAQFTSLFSAAYFQLIEADDLGLYQAYLEWLLSKVIGWRLHMEPELRDACVKVVKETILHIRADVSKKGYEDLTNLMLYRYITFMPEVIRKDIQVDVEFLKRLDEDLTSIITIEPFNFIEGEFWQAAASAISGGEQTIQAVNDKADVHFSLLEENGKKIIILDSPSQKERIGLNQPEFYILSSSLDDREQFLKSQRYTFDCSEQEFTQLVDELLRTANPTDRVHRLLKIWEDSAGIAYRDLATRLRQNNPLNLRDLTKIKIGSLQRYLHLENGQNKNDAIRDIIQQLGIGQALFRYSGIPSPLPQSLLDTLDELMDDEREKLLLHRIQAPRSVPETIHLLRLLYRYQDTHPALKQEIEGITEYLLGERGQQEVEAFLTLLMWVHQRFLLDQKFVQLSTELKILLTWTHTHHIAALMNASRIDFAWVKSTFQRENQRMSVEILLQDDKYWNDVAHPRLMTYERLTLTGLLYASDGHNSTLSEATKQRLSALMFPTEHEDVRYPALFLAFHPALLRDNSHSFLRQGLGESYATIISGLDGTQYTQSAIITMLEGYIQGILANERAQHHNVFPWILLTAALLDFQLPKELIQPLRELVLTVNWVRLFSEEYDVWRVAFNFVVAQAPHLGENAVLVELRKVLQEIVTKCNEREQETGLLEDTQRSQIISIVLEAAFRTSVDVPSGELKLETFANIVINLSWRWKHLQSVSRKVLQVMCEDLPLAYAQQLWSVLVVLRAM